MRGAEQRRLVVEDHVHGNLRHERRLAPLGGEALHEAAARYPLQHLDDDAAGHVDAPDGQHGQRQVSRLRAVDGEKHLHGLRAGRAGGREPHVADDGARILGVHAAPRLRGHLALQIVGDEIEHVLEPGPRHDPLVGDAPETAPQKIQQEDLALVARGEIAVPPLRGGRHVALAMPEEHRLPQAGARRDDRAVAGAALPRVQRVELVGRQEEDAERRRLQVVHELDTLGAAGPLESVGRDLPGEVRGGDPAVDNRPGDAERGGGRTRGVPGQEFLHDRFEAGILAARERGLGGPAERALRLHGVERQVCLRAADVAGQNERGHAFLPEMGRRARRGGGKTTLVGGRGPVERDGARAASPGEATRAGVWASAVQGRFVRHLLDLPDAVPREEHGAADGVLHLQPVGARRRRGDEEADEIEPRPCLDARLALEPVGGDRLFRPQRAQRVRAVVEVPGGVRSAQRLPVVAQLRGLKRPREAVAVGHAAVDRMIELGHRHLDLPFVGERSRRAGARHAIDVPLRVDLDAPGG